MAKTSRLRFDPIVTHAHTQTLPMTQSRPMWVMQPLQRCRWSCRLLAPRMFISNLSVCRICTDHYITTYWVQWPCSISATTRRPGKLLWRFEMHDDNGFSNHFWSQLDEVTSNIADAISLSPRMISTTVMGRGTGGLLDGRLFSFLINSSSLKQGFLISAVVHELCESECADLHIQIAQCGVDRWIFAGQFSGLWHWLGWMGIEKQIRGRLPKR